MPSAMPTLYDQAQLASQNLAQTIEQELEAYGRYLLVATKLEELYELIQSGKSSLQDVAQAMKEYEVKVEDGTAVNAITPRQRELLEERELRARVEAAMAEAGREYRPLPPMDIRRVYPADEYAELNKWMMERRYRLGYNWDND